jgi:hypothetical protein
MKYVLNISLLIAILNWGGISQSLAQESQRIDRTGRSIKIQSNSTVKKRKTDARKKGKAKTRDSIKISPNSHVKENHTRDVKRTRGEAIKVRGNTAKKELNTDAHKRSKKQERGAVKVVGNLAIDHSVGNQLNRRGGQSTKEGRSKDKKRSRPKYQRKKRLKKRKAR